MSPAGRAGGPALAASARPEGGIVTRDLPMPEQDQPAPAETAIAALRDLTEAVAEVAGRLYDLPPEDAA